MRNLCFRSQRLAFTQWQIRESSRRLISSRPTSSKRNEDLCLDSAHFWRGRFCFCRGGPTRSAPGVQKQINFRRRQHAQSFLADWLETRSTDCRSDRNRAFRPGDRVLLLFLDLHYARRNQSVRHREWQGHAGRATIGLQMGSQTYQITVKAIQAMAGCLLGAIRKLSLHSGGDKDHPITVSAAISTLFVSVFCRRLHSARIVAESRLRHEDRRRSP